MLRKLIVAAIAVAVFLITPYFLYQQHFAFHFGAAELRAAVRGTWHLELAPQLGPSRSITFTIDQAGPPAHAERERGWIRPASACGHRTLVKSAEACLDVSEMQLTLVAAGGDRSLSPTATLRVIGLTFERAQLELELDGHLVEASISRAGAVLDVHATGTAYASVSLARLEASAPTSP